MTETTIIERLLAHRTLSVVPRAQLEWLASVGTLRRLPAGEVLVAAGAPVGGMWVMLDGHTSIRVDRGTGPHIVMEWYGGDVSGVLPYSRIKGPPGDVIAEAPTELLAVDATHIPYMIRECYELTEVLVHVMLDRVRVFQTSELHDEKMASLGRLAAGLAHELNNPASAVARSAKSLVAELESLDNATKQFCLLNLSDTQCFSIAALRNERPVGTSGASPLEVSDREEALADWLDEHGIAGVELEPLAASAFAPRDLDALSSTVGVDKVGTVLTHIASGQNVRRLAAEISIAASRIHALVSAVKGFTYMDQQAALQPVDVGRGLTDTITVMGAKARAKSVEVSLEIEDNLPPVDGSGGELNQVWSNLLDNAIDATPNGRVRIIASVPLDKVVVRIIDNGPGVPADVAARIFDPFFTTKPVGEGTGLGLDISRRIVHRHGGTIDLHTDETGAEFRIMLPISKSAAHSN